MFLLTTSITRGQAVYQERLNEGMAIDLLKLLNKTIDDTTRIDILLKLAEYKLQKAGDEKSDLDSAAELIRNAKEINAKKISRKRDGTILLHESTLTRKRGNTDAARQLVSRAIGQLQLSNDEFHLTLAYLELSRCYDSKEPEQTSAIKNAFNILFQRISKSPPREQQDIYLPELMSFYILKMGGDSRPIKLDFLDHFVSAYQLVNDKVNEFWVRKEIADIHYQSGKLDVAIKELLELGNEQKAGGFPRICFTYDLLSGLYYAAARYDKALYYSLEAIKNVRTELDSSYLSNFYARVAANYGASGNPAEAIEWNRERLNYLIAVNQKDGIYAIIYNITSDLIRLHKQGEALDMIIKKSNTIAPKGNEEKRSMLLCLAQCYAAVKNTRMAKMYSQELIKINELRIKRMEITSDPYADRFLASFYLSIGQHVKAEKYFQKTMAGLPDLKKGTVLLFKNSFLFKLYSVRGNYISAIKHLQDWQTVKDSIFTATKSKQIEDLKIDYQTEQKDSLINFKEQNIRLLTKQDQLQKSQLKQGAILRNISFAFVFLLIIIVALLYNRYRLKQRTNRKLEIQQQEISKQNSTLQHLLNEKDWLVKEIHHRVKNNLQIVMSLLNSQSAYINNESALTAIHDSQHRVHAMSLIHQKLYNSENLSSINISIYIRELISYLADSFNTEQRIRFEFDIDPLEMDVSQAVPLGLVLNEAITNSIKYAFPEKRNGVISISLKNTAPNRYLLVISDNGIGMPSNFSNKKPGSLGMSLMAGLSEDLDGNFSIENNKGTTIRISFVHNMNIGRPGTIVPSVVSNN